MLGYSRAFYELFEGAIYMHRADQYLVKKLDLIRHKAYCTPTKVDYHTSCWYVSSLNSLFDM